MTEKPQTKPDVRTTETPLPVRTVTVATQFPIDALAGADSFPTITAEGVELTEDQLEKARAVADSLGVGLIVSEQKTP
jgi:hypothetical protein